ncbi:MAG: metallophosphoesterase [Methanobacteriaceae archaeon]|jgi:3',5'-cyclic AMP phosphodiesterase CpdA
MVFIAHLSDMHLGAFNFKEDFLISAINKVNELNTDLAVVTGDITQNGFYAEFETAAKYLDLIECPVLVVPGNHDARHMGTESFEEIVTKRCNTLKLITKRCNTLSVTTSEISAIGLDSSEPDLDYGKVGRWHQKRMENELKYAGGKNLYKIIALHHHIIPVPKTGRERNVLIDAGDVLESVIDGNADLVLSGHKHVPYAWQLQGTGFVTAGTVSSLKLRGKDICSFNTINIKDDDVEIVLNYVDGSSRVLAKYKNMCKVID